MMTHTAKASPGQVSDLPPNQIEDQDLEDEVDDGEGLTSSAPKPKPRLSRQAALLAGHDLEDKKNRQLKTALGSSSTTNESGANSTDNDGGSVDRAKEDEEADEEKTDQETSEKSIKSRMKSFLNTSSFGKKKKSSQSEDSIAAGSKSSERSVQDERSNVASGEKVIVNRSPKVSRAQQFKQKTKSFTAKLHVPKPTFRAKSVDEDMRKKDEEGEEQNPPKASSLTSVIATNTPDASPVRSPRIKGGKHFLTPEVTVSDQEESGSFEHSCNIFGIHIHNTDRKLKCSKLVVHPVIKVHVIDSLTGKYLKKLHPDRNVVSYYENKSDQDGIDYIMPIMTQPCDLLKHVKYPRAPVWEELLLYNEDFDYFLNNRVILFFEILDFISLDAMDVKKPRNQWWHRISWAFLRLVGADGRLNTEKKLRLQLFKANSLKINTECIKNQTTELFLWWSNGQRNAISGSLFVSVKAIPISQNQFKVKPSLRSLLPFQQESGSALSRFRDKSPNGSFESRNQSSSGNAIDHEPQVVRNQVPRIHGLPCQVPKIAWKEFSAGNNKSCYSVKFSRDGQRLACGASVFAAYLSAEKRSSIFIYEVPSGKFYRRVNGFHLGTIYDIDWSIDDRLIMSASNDCTAQVWPVSKEKATPVILPHPCFIYSCKFCPHPSNQYLIFTGAFDGFIRLWSVAKCFESSHSSHSTKEPDLLRQLDGHQGHVLSLDFKQVQINDNESDLIMFSSGSIGSVILWKCPGDETKRSGIWDLCDWEIVRKIRISELKNVPINCIKVCPSGTKLLLCCRDGRLRMIDYDLDIVVQKYPATYNFSHLIRGSMSPCGKYIFMGTEEGFVHVWKSDSGEKIHSYEDLPFKGPVTCVEYHPFQDIVAMCGLGGRTVSVCLIKHSNHREEQEKEKVEEEEEEDQYEEEPLLTIPVPSRPTRNPLNKSRTVDQSSDNRPQNVLKKAIRRAEVAIRMKSLE